MSNHNPPTHRLCRYATSYAQLNASAGLLAAGGNVVCVYTQPERPKTGAGRKLTPLRREKPGRLTLAIEVRTAQIVARQRRSG